MRKRVVVLSCAFFLSLVAMAQDSASRAVVLGGYSYLRNGSNGSNGWEGQGTFNFKRFLGIMSEVIGRRCNLLFLLVSMMTPSVTQACSEYLFRRFFLTGFLPS